MPGVIIEDASPFPGAITDGPPALPAFIGCTAQAVSVAGESLLLTPTRISSLVEYERLFGGPADEPVTVALRTNRQRAGGVEVAGVQPSAGAPVFLLPWAVRHYFDNGGSGCFIISVGACSSPPEAASLLDGVNAAANETAITLLVVPDAATLPAWSAFRAVTTGVLVHCGRLERRFAVIDVWRGDRSLTATVDVDETPGNATPMRVVDASRRAWTDHLSHGAAYYPFLETSYPRFASIPPALVTVTLDGVSTTTLAHLQVSEPQRGDLVSKALSDIHVVLPPSGAVAGVYALMDATRGVWKPPANVSLNSVLKPAATVTDAQQQSLNIDVSGLSVNAIRAFAGKGTLVWGARTLAGNDNDWRYVNVRRLVDTIERSVLASTQWVVFEPNDANTWSTLTAVIENYLTLFWRQGALQGTRPDEAFWVRCALGETMTQADVDRGVLRVTIALAPVRPAEFLLVGLTYAVQGS